MALAMSRCAAAAVAVSKPELCIVDAVYNIGVYYDRHVLPVVRRIAADTGIEAPSVPPRGSRLPSLR